MNTNWRNGFQKATKSFYVEVSGLQEIGWKENKTLVPSIDVS